jgi:cell division protein FtsB
MGIRRESTGSSTEILILGLMTVVSVALGGLLLSNHEGVKQRAAEVDRVERDLVSLAEEIGQLSDLERNRAFNLVERERLARERLHWTAPGEYVIRVESP